MITCIFFTPILGIQKIKVTDPGPYFYIAVLCPNTNPARNQWATLMVEQLPKIGIGVSIFDLTGWAQISPRTWGHSYPIPTYAEGGYDVLFTGWSWGFDWNPGLFHSSSMPPNGDNLYQYNSSDMDATIDNYISSFVLEDRIEYMEEIQSILYEDNPSVSIVYPASVYPFNNSFTGWDSLLWSATYQPMNNWSILDKTEFHYAVPASFEDFHIMTYESVYDAQWLHQIYNGLVERNISRENGYGPWLAESFS